MAGRWAQIRDRRRLAVKDRTTAYVLIGILLTWLIWIGYVIVVGPYQGQPLAWQVVFALAAPPVLVVGICIALSIPAALIWYVVVAPLRDLLMGAYRQ